MEAGTELVPELQQRVLIEVEVLIKALAASTEAAFQSVRIYDPDFLINNDSSRTFLDFLNCEGALLIAETLGELAEEHRKDFFFVRH